MEGIVALIGGLLGLLLVLWFFIFLPADMARNRNRSALGWVLMSVLFSPILAILLLALLGKAPSDERAAQ